MPTITLHCHPSRLYYWLVDEIIDKGVEGLWIAHEGKPYLPVNRRNDYKIASYCISAVMVTKPPHHRDVVLYSEDVDLLCRIKLTAPTRHTPPIDD